MAEFHQPGDELDILVGAGGAKPGALIEYAGVVGIVGPKPDGTDWVQGETGAVRVNAVVRIPNPDNVAFTDGATVGYDATNDKATAAAGGDFDCGTAVGAHSGSETDVIVRLTQ